MQEAITHLRASDPVLCAIIERVGDCGIHFYDPTFESLARSIIFQQLSGKVARVIFERLVLATRQETLTADGILKLRPSRMRSVGLSKQKITYIRDLARLTRAGEIEFEALSNLGDAEVIERLTRVKGIGVWTAHMFLIFALRRPDVLATGDLGIRTAIRKAYGLVELPGPAEMQSLAQHWTPYRSVACWYLWRSLESGANL